MSEPWVTVFAVTLAYLAVSLAIGLFSGRRTSSGTEGYVAGDRTLGFLVMYFIMGASIFSAFAFLGGPGWAYSRGAAAYYIIAYGLVGLVPWYFMGPKIARLGRSNHYVTQAELLADRYQSRGLSVLLALVSLVAFIPYLQLQMQGAGYVFSTVTEGRVPEWAGAGIAYSVVLIYVFRSGVVGVGWTNTFQGILMLSLAWILGLYLPYKLYGGLTPMFERLASEAPQMLIPPGLDSHGEPWSWGGYSSAVAISVFGFSVWPHTFMKIYTARNTRILKQTVVFYPTFQIFLVPILLIGFSAILAYPGVEPADAILPTVMMSMDLPPLVVGLFCAGALAASMSTGDALVHAAGSILIKDGYRVLCGPGLSEAAQTKYIRFSVIAIGALSYYFAVGSSVSLVYLLLLSYGAIAQILPVVLATLYWRGSTPAGVLSGLLAGCLVTLVWNLFPGLQWQDIHPGVWGIVANAITLGIVSQWSRKLPPEHVDRFVEG